MVKISGVIPRLRIDGIMACSEAQGLAIANGTVSTSKQCSRMQPNGKETRVMNGLVGPPALSAFPHGVIFGEHFFGFELTGTIRLRVFNAPLFPQFCYVIGRQPVLFSSGNNELVIPAVRQ